MFAAAVPWQRAASRCLTPIAHDKGGGGFLAAPRCQGLRALLLRQHPAAFLPCCSFFFFSLFSPSSPARPSGRAPSRASLTAARQPPSSLLQQLSKQLRGGSPFPGGRSPSHTCFLAPLTSQDAHRSPARTVRTAAHTEEGFPNHSTSACGAKIRGQLPADGCFRCLTWALASQALWCGVCTSSTINESGRIMRRSNENICRLAALCSLPF